MSNDLYLSKTDPMKPEIIEEAQPNDLIMWKGVNLFMSVCPGEGDESMRVHEPCPRVSEERKENNTEMK